MAQIAHCMTLPNVETIAVSVISVVNNAKQVFMIAKASLPPVKLNPPVLSDRNF